ncbi:MAG: hypothetical protein JF588_04015 [Caulobacterales bacterium]|nr:hypothetical protein [Caulobacterales bacterium]
MTLQPLLAALEAQPFAQAIREGTFLFPAIECVHVLAVVIVVGVVFLMDLRLLGGRAHSASLRRLLADAVPCAWTAFAVALVTGFLLFSSSATTYAANPAFQLKFVAMAAAGLNMALFHGLGLKDAATWDAAAKPPRSARIAGLVSLACWVVVVASGRWIGFLA